MANPYRQDAERCLLEREARTINRRAEVIHLRRAGRPKDGPERAKLLAAIEEYNAAHGELELVTILSAQSGKRCHAIASPGQYARRAAEQLFTLPTAQRDGSASRGRR